MYTLRVIIEERQDASRKFEKVIDNYALGNSYRVAKKGASKQFEEGIKEFSEESENGVKAVLFSEKEQTWFIMESSENVKYSYFIMTESGQTFEKL
jgi:hypothetical protein